APRSGRGFRHGSRLVRSRLNDKPPLGARRPRCLTSRIRDPAVERVAEEEVRRNGTCDEGASERRRRRQYPIVTIRPLLRSMPVGPAAPKSATCMTPVKPTRLWSSGTAADDAQEPNAFVPARWFRYGPVTVILRPQRSVLEQDDE